ncbi:SDR family NAD(P)-dependent oxidoreductase [Candidatus Pacearchaeota archaeon]|nr:SDR family NAD(P)-dependent oxidoreductase [Candidatus Pacearchaeota archaeon]
MTKETALITGASNGLGEHLAYVFADNGYDLILNGRNLGDLARISRRFEKNADTNVEIIQGDLRENETIDKLYEAAQKQDITVLINNAALPCPDVPFENITEQHIYDMVSTNLMVPIRLTQRIYPIFQEKNKGRIVNINSIISLETKNKRTLSTACKSGLAGFSKGLRTEAAKHNISILDVYMSRARTKPHYEWGMDTDYVVNKIFEYQAQPEVDELVIDGRPLKVREKTKPLRIYIDARHKSI